MAFVYLERMFTLRGFVKLAVLNPKKMSHIRRSADAIRFGATVKPTPIESTFNTHWDIPFGSDDVGGRCGVLFGTVLHLNGINGQCEYYTKPSIISRWNE